MADELQNRWEQESAGRRYLSAQQTDAVAAYLADIHFLLPGEEITGIGVPGEGNMNVTLRVLTTRRNFIVKQSRPWVARFPQLAAPEERILIEREFYRATRAEHFLSGHMPELLRADAGNFTLIFEDLLDADDMVYVYEPDQSFTRSQLSTLLEFAARLHALPVDSFDDNLALKTLNHAHIFDLPFRPDNGFPLDAIYPGLAEVARPFQHDTRLRSAVARLGEEYLKTGTTLIHGDYHPASFLDNESRVYVIDTEFAHLGRPEFDIGILMAHLLLSRATEKRILQIDTDYRKPAGFDAGLARRFSQVEIMRRLIGIAQLPVSITLDERRQLLERARLGLI